MSWISRMIEERLAEAAADGELDTPHLRGRELDLDAQRPQGWWADQFVARELSHDRRRTAETAAAKARVGFWRAETVGELQRQVAAANAAIVRANINLVETDRLDRFDPVDIEDRWRALPRL